MSLLELKIVLSAAATVGGYHVYFVVELRRSPERSLLGQARKWRLAWIERVIARQESILAVQTLRNWTMSTSFLASTALLISAAILGFLFGADKASQLIHQLNLLGVTSNTLLTIKLLLLVANFFAAFFNFSLTLRYYNYVALTINIAEQTAQSKLASDCAFQLTRGAFHYSLGMRSYYLAIPLALWLFGPIWFAVGAIALTIGLCRHDHAR